MPDRITLSVEVTLDSFPGAFHTPESAEGYLQAILDLQIPHYNPSVLLIEPDPSGEES